jgi:hypothetical protein
MNSAWNRRSFLVRTSAAGAVAGLGDLAFLTKLRPVSAEEARPESSVVRLRPEIEPLVALLEETPRDEVLERVAHKIRHGTSYRELVAALLLAGVKNVQPRPSVGFKFHAVLVVNSAHLASISSPDGDRWLPILWAIDNFKSSQARDEQEGNWTMQAVDESTVPPATKAVAAFRQAMDRWDESAADAAVAGLARTAGANQVFEEFFRYGARDFRSIGHKAIYVANSWRTLDTIGWQHAEPVLRSLAYALLNHEGEPNPAQSDLGPDRAWRRNESLAEEIRRDWLEGELSGDATTEMLATLREGSSEDACDKVVELINRGVAPQSVWDACLVGAGELLMRQPGIVALHAMTSTNALRYAFDASGNDNTRRMLLLQNAAFLTLFREAMGGRGRVSDEAVDRLEGLSPEAEGEAAIAEIFADVSEDRMRAAQKIFAVLQDGRPAGEIIDAARRLVFLKGDDSHDYKFSSAALEDYYKVSPAWRDRYLAASVFNLHGSGEPDNPLTHRIRSALA